jgi:hypothetical protein
MPLAQRRTADAKDYVEPDLDDDDLLDEDDEDIVAETSSALQSGWEAALNASKSDSKRFTNEFRFTEEPQLIKFLTNEPFAVFEQHWIERSGKRSFVCLGDGCPLCDKGDAPRAKVAFSIVNLSAEEPVVEMLLTGPMLTNQLASLDKDPKTGPLDRIYWSLSRQGKGPKTTYSVIPVKPRDLDEDWGCDQAEVEATIDKFEPLTAKVIALTPRSELADIAREINRA